MDRKPGSMSSRPVGCLSKLGVSAVALVPVRFGERQESRSLLRPHDRSLTLSIARCHAYAR